MFKDGDVIFDNETKKQGIVKIISEIYDSYGFGIDQYLAIHINDEKIYSADYYDEKYLIRRFLLISGE